MTITPEKQVNKLGPVDSLIVDGAWTITRRRGRRTYLGLLKASPNLTGRGIHAFTRDGTVRDGVAST